MERGIVLYNIELDGCLNGVYTNEGCDGVIYNEIARKLEKSDTTDISGEYLCTYFDMENTRVSCRLFIANKNDSERIYMFTWRTEAGNAFFEGTGFLMNEKQIAVHYKSV